MGKIVKNVLNTFWIVTVDVNNSKVDNIFIKENVQKINFVSIKKNKCYANGYYEKVNLIIIIKIINVIKILMGA